MEGKKFIFIAGLHRSGTSMLHEIIRSHPNISGFHNTGVPADEGQHLQNVYEPALRFGGPGKFAFNCRSRMDESHPLVSSANAKKLFEQWRPHFDMSCDHLVEKSPPNIIRTRFLQKLFPHSKFIFILRHPLAVSYATQKWSGTSIQSLLEHYLLAHEIMIQDFHWLNSFQFLRYEALVADPQLAIDGIFNFLQLTPIKVIYDIKRDVNEKYFQLWEKDSKNSLNNKLEEKLETKINTLGYSIKHYHEVLPVPWLDAERTDLHSNPQKDNRI